MTAMLLADQNAEIIRVGRRLKSIAPAEAALCGLAVRLRI